MPPLTSLPIFAVLGVTAGFFGVLFNRGLLTAIGLYARLPNRFVLPAVAITGGVIGPVGWFSPMMLSSGHTLAKSTLKGDLLLAAIPLIFVIRFLFTTTSYGSGAPGGIFAPLLVLGAFIGLAIGQIGHNLAPAIVPSGGCFRSRRNGSLFHRDGAVRLLPGIMLIVEIAGNYSQMLPSLIACFCAYAVADF